MALDVAQSADHGFGPQTVFAVPIVEQNLTNHVFRNPVSCVGCASLKESAQPRNHNLL
jgi:hypothetical protein